MEPIQVLIPLSNERLHCGTVSALDDTAFVRLIPLSNERLHCGCTCQK